MSKFDKKSLSLRLRRRPTSSVRSRHNDNERQTLSNLTLKIWTIFDPTQKASDDAHARRIYLSPVWTAVYAKSVSFFLLLVGRQSRAVSVVTMQ